MQYLQNRFCQCCRGEIEHSITTEKPSKSLIGGRSKVVKLICWLFVEIVWFAFELTIAAIFP